MIKSDLSLENNSKKYRSHAWTNKPQKLKQFKRTRNMHGPCREAKKLKR